ncbi:WecB/TagA/CpsF family glycosyltransferase [Holophaga foetida]|uniref:WecB/TagA/CpsF family glycosyltransferase n=1 Tax=Holophaga foetida TaxID=35839 RepID=UPI0002473F45|nr:WecB/TagA/CpsF family glycosyltransferase [Holophaga foetida]
MLHPHPTTTLLQIPLWLTTKAALQQSLRTHLETCLTPISLYTLNPEIIMLGQRNSEYLSVLRQGNWNVVDGVGVALALTLRKKPCPERLCGSDLVHVFARAAQQCGRPIFFLGGSEKHLAQAITNLKDSYPGLAVFGFSPTYHPGLPLIQQSEITSLLQKTRPAVVAVCLGAPRQEMWIHSNMDILKASGVGLAAGLGGTIDFLSGEVPRAPLWVRKAGLEWLFRLLREPRRLRRQLTTLPVFLAIVFMESLKFRTKGSTPKRDYPG